MIENSNIHPTAIVSSKAILGENVSIGPYAVIGDGVEIRSGCLIHGHAQVLTGTFLKRSRVRARSCLKSLMSSSLKFKLRCN